jgi:HemY protein
MIKLIWRFAILAVLAALFAWLADRPGTVSIVWMRKEVTMPLFAAAAALVVAVFLVWFGWSFIRKLWRSPATVNEYFRFRRSRKGYESLSKGMLAAGAGDAVNAARHAQIAARGLAGEPLVKLLEAQAAQLKGDRSAVIGAFEDMLKSRDTEALGLRGLFADARAAGDIPKARGFAERALKLNGALSWASGAMLQLQSATKDWDGALATLESQRKSGLLKPADADRKKAAVYAAQALVAEGADRRTALDLALKAHRLDPSLVPSAVVAGRIYTNDGALRKALRILSETWTLTPHPEIADAVAFAKPGDTPEGRLKRMRDLVAHFEGGAEGKIALASAAILAREWKEARRALESLAAGRPQARVCALMADLEEGETGDKGRAREWLARAVNAPRDPMWIADGAVLPAWSPVSPVTGELAVCQWKVPFESPEPPPAAARPPPEPEPQPAALPSPAPEPASPSTAKAAATLRQPDDPGPDASM